MEVEGVGSCFLNLPSVARTHRNGEDPLEFRFLFAVGEILLIERGLRSREDFSCRGGLKGWCPPSC